MGPASGEERRVRGHIVPPVVAVLASGAPMSDEAVRALWLKSVQTRPADFLKSRFAYQLQAATP
jgi:hypothetical protein